MKHPNAPKVGLLKQGVGSFAVCFKGARDRLAGDKRDQNENRKAKLHN